VEGTELQINKVQQLIKEIYINFINRVFNVQQLLIFSRNRRKCNE